MSVLKLDRGRVAQAVKKVVIAESRLAISPDQVADDEPLNGALLRINSLGFVGMLIQLEEQLDVTLSDDLFVGRSFTTVADLVDVIQNHSEVSA
ncbi:acyl carrier protein [Pseudomonas sp. ADAK18]|uniref:acyl carrier protein n=1 Tax=Pseudomonas sp. ADAK18 TaxID=2730848 RepID=UPI0014630C76|nr:acyl carrier protein [Pseudomonas sp. ADAK18]QJI31085.1 acyl carrier protein [Pseudomonas sp. ADAK18]